MSIRTRLLLLVFAAWLPAAAGFGLLARSTYLREADAAQQRIQQQADRLNAQVERELDLRVVMARTLSASAALRADALRALHAEAGDATRGTDSWVLLNSSDRQLLNTRFPFDSEGVPRLNPGRALLPGPPQVRFARRGPLSTEPVVGVFAAEMSPQPRYEIGVGFRAAVLQSLLEGSQTPAGAVAAVIDQFHTVAARNRDPARWVGMPVNASLLQRLQARQSGFAESVTLDGVASLTYLSPPNRHGWTIAVGLPLAMLAQTANRLTVQGAAASAALLLVGLAVALLASRRISRPMEQLRDAARQLEDDAVPPPLSTGVREADAVASALHRAGVHSQRARQELRSRVADAVQQAQQAQRKLLDAQKHEAIGRLTGGIAHDFNNLLQTISAGIQLTLRKLPEGPQRRALEAALGASAKAAGLVRQMQAFGRETATEARPVRLADWLLGAQELLRKSLQDRITLQAQIPPGLPALLVDPTQLELALLNLIFNARDAMPQGGQLTLAAQRAEPAHIQGLAPGEYLSLTVSDTGEGMDAHTLAKAVEPYFTTKPVGQGSGLGLAQVRAFARQSGGDLRLASAPGAGTQAMLVLPVAQAEARSGMAPPAPAAPAAAQPAGQAERGLAVLMVEDDTLAASVVMPALAEAGHQVRLCENANLARTVLEGPEHFDVLFTDVVMPGRMDGIDLVRWARQARPGLPALVATGFTAQALDTELRVLRKPYAIDALLAALQQASVGPQPAPRP
ncbi:ATP-binding protein [Aquincola tertiaricarbonis]|uniref:ATP-binding protein n=1 Tax=Aquincola tertiaricarbonis TaxID=391953 RepID=UPI000698731D|nr:ATP-binding protein [Aquincola tertiaricarbonis]